MDLSRLKPGASRRRLLALAGLVWTVVGIVLCRTSYGWLAETSGPRALALALLGLGSAVAAYRFGFLRIARRNIERIQASADGACVFSFQSWKGYITVGAMIVLGIALRKSSIPRPLLALVYLIIGGGLLLASLQYYGNLWSGGARGDR